ncbi:hypothetical protein [Absidia glauca]|uniref:Uncharacterized protein n=1 Tax=Absidia glauca TaxID=4829 RepID=A0A168SC78_ABSGL|nr:hypothetical protein [Absidia glauca]
MTSTTTNDDISQLVAGKASLSLNINYSDGSSSVLTTSSPSSPFCQHQLPSPLNAFTTTTASATILAPILKFKPRLGYKNYFSARRLLLLLLPLVITFFPHCHSLYSTTTNEQTDEQTNERTIGYDDDDGNRNDDDANDDSTTASCRPKRHF